MSKNNKSEIVIGNNTYYRINDDTFINVSEIKKIKIDNKHAIFRTRNLRFDRH